MARVTFTSAMRRIMPPWLQRTVGGALMEALGASVETLVTRTAAGVKLRFPAHDESAIDGDALSYIGRDRRIRRGPAEDEVTYARRLRLWLDSHRTRGGAYALLRQLYAYTVDWLNVRMDVVAQSGHRRWIDTAGVITADDITWDGHGQPPIEGPWEVAAMNASAGDTSIYFGFHSDLFDDDGGYQVRVWSSADPVGEVVLVRHQTDEGYLHFTPPLANSYSGPKVATYRPQWAHAWVFFYLPELIEIGVDYLVTSDGDYLVTSDGDRLVATRTISPGAITTSEAAIFTTIVREWSAAHLPYITVVLLWGTRRLWNYPQPVPTWTAWGASGALWGDSPVMLRAE